VVVYVVTTLLQIFNRMCRWKKIENRSIFGEDADKNLSLTFLAHPDRWSFWSWTVDRLL